MAKHIYKLKIQYQRGWLKMIPDVLYSLCELQDFQFIYTTVMNVSSINCSICLHFFWHWVFPTSFMLVISYVFYLCLLSLSVYFLSCVRSSFFFFFKVSLTESSELSLCLLLFVLSLCDSCLWLDFFFSDFSFFFLCLCLLVCSLSPSLPWILASFLYREWTEWLQRWSCRCTP